ncbi:MAG: SMC family ATPase [Candidatus Lokiarchaeota archaeon]|nr:SMC family ATPase [Candidatus Lokiarchaeota archaeon]
MLITKLNFTNFMGYKQLNLPKGKDEFPGGLILISGRNSFGKSTILEGILFAFFGPRIFKGRNAASFITYGTQEKAKIYVYFTLDKRKYYIYRKWGRTGSITTKLFELPENRKIYQEIKQFNVEKFFELSSEQAMSTVFVRQGEVEELANKRGAELREMLINLFRLNIIDDALSFLDNELKGKKYEKENLEKSRVPIERIKEDITHIEKENNQLRKIIADQENKIENYNKKVKDFPSNELISKLENLHRNQKSTKDKFLSYENDFKAKIKKTDLRLEDLDSQDTINKEIETLTKNKFKVEREKDEIDKKREVTVKGLGKTKGRIEDVKKSINKMEKSLQFTKLKEGKEIAQCPTCQNELTKEHYNEIIQKFTEDININQNKINSISQLLTDFDKEIKLIQIKLDKIKENITIHQGLKEDFENYKKYESELGKFDDDLKIFLSKYRAQIKDSSLEGIRKIAIEKEKITTELKALMNSLNEKHAKVQANQERIGNLQKEIKKMKDLIKKIGDYEVDIDHINKAKEFVRRFVTEYMVVKRLVKNIALTTDKYIKDFTSGQYSDLLLDLSGTRKTGLSLKIRDNYNGEYESTEVLSGGDRTALGIALRLAISELMSSIRPTKDSPRRNPKVDFLLLDEPLAALDETRRERILKHLIKSKSFSQIFLITHTTIPPDIHAHKIIVDKDVSTGISKARFEKPTVII